MKLTGYGSPCLDGHIFRYQRTGISFSTVTHIMANPYEYHTYLSGVGERWLSILNVDEGCPGNVREIKDDRSGLVVASISSKDGNSYDLRYLDCIVNANEQNGQYDFTMDGKHIGFVGEIRDSKGNRIRYPAADELRIAEFNDGLDDKLVMLLLGTEYLVY